MRWSPRRRRRPRPAGPMLAPLCVGRRAQRIHRERDRVAERRGRVALHELPDADETGVRGSSSTPVRSCRTGPVARSGPRSPWTTAASARPPASIASCAARCTLAPIGPRAASPPMPSASRTRAIHPRPGATLRKTDIVTPTRPEPSKPNRCLLGPRDRPLDLGRDAHDLDLLAEGGADHQLGRRLVAPAGVHGDEFGHWAMSRRRRPSSATGRATVDLGRRGAVELGQLIAGRHGPILPHAIPARLLVASAA